MKLITCTILALFTSNSFSSEITYSDRPRIREVHCEASSSTGVTKFDYRIGDASAISITDSIFNKGITDSYSMPNFAVLSQTGNPEPLEYGKSFVSFIIQNNSPSANRFFGFQFVLAENPKYGSKVYEATLLGTNIGGFPSPGKTFYTYIGKGSCEVNLEKR